MPIYSPALTSRSVTEISSALGETLPEGWKRICSLIISSVTPN